MLSDERLREIVEAAERRADALPHNSLARDTAAALRAAYGDGAQAPERRYSEAEVRKALRDQAIQYGAPSVAERWVADVMARLPGAQPPCRGCNTSDKPRGPCDLCGMVLCRDCAERNESPGGYGTCCDETEAPRRLRGDGEARPKVDDHEIACCGLHGQPHDSCAPGESL